MKTPPSSTTIESTVDTFLDNPLPVLREPRPLPTPADEEEVDLDAPLPALRAPRPAEDSVDLFLDAMDVDRPGCHSPHGEQEGRLVFNDRSSSPTGTEPHNEEPEDLEYIPGSGESGESNIGAGHSTTDATSSAETEAFPLPPSSSSHSMRNASIRSFESRARQATAVAVTTAAPTATSVSTSAPASSSPETTTGIPPPAPKKSGARPSRNSTRSLSSLSPTEPAPSDDEFYKIAKLHAPPKKETANEHRVRADANERLMISWVLQLQKSLEDHERAQMEQNKEILRRLADLQLSTPAASSSLSLNTASDIARLKKLVAEGRQSITLVTDWPASNALFAPLSLRPAASSASSSSPSSSQSARTGPVSPSPAHDTARNSNVAHSTASGSVSRYRAPSPDVVRDFAPSSNNKRQRDLSPEPERPAKQHKGPEDYFDVYLWDINLGKASAITAARAAVKATGLDPRSILSSLHPVQLPKGLISIRFVDADVGQRFLDRMRTNPPKGMENLNVATPASYGKRRANSNARKEDKFW
ncbi:hypothetical protein DFH09DRAFT_1455657 [Mycena vulgaris]|nr:hypothetical protein DFH09DRAFT_1455657 [Mycena vulgaris]